MSAGLAYSARADVEINGLLDDVTVAYDVHRVPTIQAQNEHDAIFMLGYVHAGDRFFQMDLLRRVFAGKGAELVGPAGLPQDVQLRTLGIYRAAAASLPIQTPEGLAWLDAYSAGVNAWLNDLSHPLSPEYTSLEITRASIPAWTPLDCLLMAKGLAFNLSFSLEDTNNTIALLAYRQVGTIVGFNGLGLFFTDLFRSAPFDPTVSIAAAKSATVAGGDALPKTLPDYLGDNTLQMLLDFREKAMEIPMLREALEPKVERKGSNWWAVAPTLTESGYAMLANDPHLGLDTPSTFYEAHLSVAGGMNVTGVTFPGAPVVVQGCNDTICWGSTVNAIDVTDAYQEVLVAIPTMGLPPGTPSHTIFEGAPEPMIPILQSFLVNVIGDMVPDTIVNSGIGPANGGLNFVVPRRNFGPIVQIDTSNPARTTAISVAYTGWGPTQELEAFRRFTTAASVADFREALQFFDFGSQNWSYADVNGNIAYFTSGELPIREDLQILQGPDGIIPPFIIRDGTHTLKHEWLSIANPQPHQMLNREILPFDEMPQVVNPASGYILNCNNDPIGTNNDNVSFNQLRTGGQGVLYLSPLYAPGFRQGRLKKLFDEILTAKTGDNKLSLSESIAIQANNQLLDAEVLSPFLLTAFANGNAGGAPPDLAALAADPGVIEAIGRIAAWDFSTPTGIQPGYDPGDDPSALPAPGQAEIDSSVAATIYSTWRGQLLRRVIDGTLTPVGLGPYVPGSNQSMAALRNLLDSYPVRQGIGISGLNFFSVPGAPNQNAARDIILLQSLRSALDLLASNSFAAAFANSTNQEDYRWGYLHRIVFDHPLGSPLNIPGLGGLQNVSPQLLGVARAGGMGALDASAHNARANSVNGFMFGSGPARRFQGILTPGCIEAWEVIPGGESGIFFSPFHIDQLMLWLVNAYHALPVCAADVQANTVASQKFVPEPPLFVLLESFSARPGPDGVTIEWVTAIERDTTGFRIYRGNGVREKALTLLTPQPIAPKGEEIVGASYEFLDRSAPGGTLVYYLEDIDLNGKATRHGPVVVTQPDRQRTMARNDRAQN